jgi:26S proteasome regulatory subunit N5
MSNPYL